LFLITIWFDSQEGVSSATFAVNTPSSPDLKKWFFTIGAMFVGQEGIRSHGVHHAPFVADVSDASVC